MVFLFLLFDKKNEVKTRFTVRQPATCEYFFARKKSILFFFFYMILLFSLIFFYSSFQPNRQRLYAFLKWACYCIVLMIWLISICKCCCLVVIKLWQPFWKPVTKHTHGTSLPFDCYCAASSTILYLLQVNCAKLSLMMLPLQQFRNWLVEFSLWASSLFVVVAVFEFKSILNL